MFTSFRSTASLALSIAALGILGSKPAQAISVVVGGITYDVLTQTLSYPQNSASFALPPLGQMPWWGDDALASEFASQVAASLGAGDVTSYGPIFAYAHDNALTQISGVIQNLVDPSDQLVSDFPDYDPLDPLVSLPYIIAYASAITPPASSSVPAPLPLFGAAAAVTWSRRIKGRFVLGKR